MKKLAISVLTLLFIFLVINNVNAETKVIYKDSPYGPVTVTIRDISPIEMFFRNLFYIGFEQSQVQSGETIDITADVNKANSPCVLSYWRVYIMKDGSAIDSGDDFTSEGNALSSCNKEITMNFATDTLGTYSLKQDYKWDSSSSGSSQTSIDYPTGYSTVTVIANSGSCSYNEYAYFQSINGGEIRISRNSCPSQYSNKYQTRCSSSGYGIDGTSATTASGIHECLSIACNSNWVCTDYGACVSGTKIRTCTDTTNCGGTNGRPSLTATCNSNPLCSGLGTDCFIGLSCCSGICTNFKCSNTATNDTNNNPTTRPPVEDLTLNTYYSTSDYDLISTNAYCRQDHLTEDCDMSLEGYTVKCDNSAAVQKRLNNGYALKCKEVLSGIPFLNSPGNKALQWLSVNILGFPDPCTTLGTPQGIMNNLKGYNGLCIAKSKSWYMSIWEMILTTVAGLGLPAQYVMLCSIGIIIALIFIGVNLLK